jgi:hypothetical protein
MHYAKVRRFAMLLVTIAARVVLFWLNLAAVYWQGGGFFCVCRPARR